jgi:hypothetical protein
MPHAAGTTVPTLAQVSHAPRAAWWWLPWSIASAVFAGIESTRMAERQTIVSWFLQAEYDTLVYLAFLMTAPFVWWWQGNQSQSRSGVKTWLVKLCDWLFGAPAGLKVSAGRRPAILSALIGLTSLATSASIGARFDHLPPAYHDEYSYLFQAETFLAGRVSFPSHPAARLFDQMHVLNEGRFASRYFPGAGLWMAPFVAAGHPYWGHWLAGAICAVLIFWIGRELAGEGAGLIAGLLTALSPGMALFSNLLLAHHPTLVGLGVFILGYLRLMRTGALGWGVLSGTGLAFATLCRPMTAAGVALPFGIYLLAWAFQAVPPIATADAAPELAGCALKRSRRWLAVICLGLPLFFAGAGMLAYDKAITGNAWLTPYSLYTDLHTPRHVYGFNNVERGLKHQGPRVIQNYDQWAENLTPRLALANACTRLTASWRWTLGLIPLTLAAAGGLVVWKRLSAGAWLILAGIVSLHAAHLPYWFVGMEDHHYVFEAGPLWAVWVGVVTTEVYRIWSAERRFALCVWWGALLAAAVVMNFEISSGVWSAPLEQGIGRVDFARTEHGRFLKLVTRRAIPRPALVLVDADPADRHIEYVANSPDLAGPLLIGRYIPEVVSLEEVRRLFPDRSVFVYRIRNVFREGSRTREEEWRRIE